MAPASILTPKDESYGREERVGQHVERSRNIMGHDSTPGSGLEKDHQRQEAHKSQDDEESQDAQEIDDIRTLQSFGDLSKMPTRHWKCHVWNTVLEKDSETECWGIWTKVGPALRWGLPGYPGDRKERNGLIEIQDTFSVKGSKFRADVVWEARKDTEREIIESFKFNSRITAYELYHWAMRSQKELAKERKKGKNRDTRSVHFRSEEEESFTLKQDLIATRSLLEKIADNEREKLYRMSDTPWPWPCRNCETANAECWDSPEGSKCARCIQLGLDKCLKHVISEFEGQGITAADSSKSSIPTDEKKNETGDLGLEELTDPSSVDGLLNIVFIHDPEFGDPVSSWTSQIHSSGKRCFWPTDLLSRDLGSSARIMTFKYQNIRSEDNARRLYTGLLRKGILEGRGALIFIIEDRVVSLIREFFWIHDSENRVRLCPQDEESGAIASIIHLRTNDSKPHFFVRYLNPSSRKIKFKNIESEWNDWLITFQRSPELYLTGFGKSVFALVAIAVNFTRKIRYGSNTAYSDREPPVQGNSEISEGHFAFQHAEDIRYQSILEYIRHWFNVYIQAKANQMTGQAVSATQSSSARPNDEAQTEPPEDQDENEMGIFDSDDDDDISSIASVQDSIFSTMTGSSMSSIMEQVDLVKDFVRLLVQHEEFGELLKEACAKMSLARVDRNLPRLFKKYAIDLRKSADISLEVETAKWTRFRFRQLAKDTRLAVFPSEDTSSHVEMASILQALEKDDALSFKVERFLEDRFPLLDAQPSSASQSKGSPSEEPEDPRVGNRSNSESSELSSEDDSETEQETTQPKNIDLVKKFLFEGDAFDSLMKELERFCGREQAISRKATIDKEPNNPPPEEKPRPSEGTEALELASEDQLENDEKSDNAIQIDTGQFSEQMLSLAAMYTLREQSKQTRIERYANSIKLLLEANFWRPISFWPLKEPRYSCKSGYTRYYWDCSCGQEMSIDISNAVAESYTAYIKQNGQPSGSGNSSREMALQSIGSLSNNCSINNNTGQASQSVTNQPPAIVGHAQNSQTLAISQPPEPLIFWCSKESKYAELMKNILRDSGSDDRSMFLSFAEAYKCIRGWRRYISLTSIADIKYVRFIRLDNPPDCRADGFCDSFVEDVPPEGHKEYIAPHCPPHRMPPLGRREFMLHFLNPDRCRGCNYLDHFMPQKVNGPLQGNWRIEAWGLQAVEGFQPLKAAAWIVVIFILSVVTFVPWWLVNHPGDLQNAFVPPFFVSALLTALLTLVPGIHEVI